MYSDLIKLLKSGNYFNEVQLKNIKGCCCDQSTRLVLDFNSIKSDFLKLIRRDHPPTVSAILFSEANKLFFLQTVDFYNLGVAIETLHEELIKGGIQNKIRGTIDTLSLMLKHNRVSEDFSTFFSQKNRDKVDTIILVGLSDQDYLKLRLSALDKLNIMGSDPIIGETKLVDCKDFQTY